MSSFTLKLLACFTMLVDHVGILFFPESIVFRIIGRLSFPLFAFLIAVGFSKTSNKRAYLSRLAVFALISQAPYMYFERLSGINDFSLNILFTLSLGVVALMVMTSRRHIALKIAGILGLLLVAQLGSFSYGAYGLLSILAGYAFLYQKPLGGSLLAILPFLDTLRLFRAGIFFPQFFAALALIPIWLYNGLPGPRVSRWWFYWFYPVHLAVLSALFVLL